MMQTTTTMNAVNASINLLKMLPSTPTSDAVLKALEEGAFERLYNGDIPFPAIHDNSSVELFTVEYLAYNLMRKYPFKGINRKAVALSAFAESEKKCAATNRALKIANRMNPGHPDIESVRRKIANLLGRFSWEAAERGFAWGPGATTRLKNKQGDVYFKFRGKPETTLYNLPLACAAIGRVPLWFGSIHPLAMADLAHVVPGSKVTTVPKDAKTDRTIAIEPCMNMYIQKGIGSLIRNRLQRVGIDLNDQNRNQELAKRGSFDGTLATIDLSAASDTVSEYLIDLLVPEDWAMALKQCRSSRYVLPCGTVKTFHKFSSMGNGYTFELESLIFWAITITAVERTHIDGVRSSVSIFGDDIICPSESVEELFRLLRFFGFEPNESKSFWNGPFRESCGKHYLQGIDVTPFYLKDGIDSAIRRTWFCNSIARWVGRSSMGEGVRSMAVRAWLNSLAIVPKSHRLFIPDGVGDGGLIGLREYEGVEFCPSDFYSVVKPVRQGKTSSDYQRGVDFVHWVEQLVDTRPRDPSDTPYLLSQLYRVKDTLKYTDRILLGLGEQPNPTGLIRVYKPKKVSGWSHSWLLA